MRTALSTPTPEVVVFDLGKVLLDFDYSLVARRLAARCAKTAVEVQSLIDQSPLLYRFECGHIDSDQFFREVVGACGYGGSQAEFNDDFGDQFTPIEPMVKWQVTLQTAHIPTYVFSNTNPIAIEHVRQAYSFFSGFQGYVFSYDHGAMKPDPKVYEAVERMTERSGLAILYLDDRLENVEAGRARGWQVIHHRTPPETMAITAALGLPSPGPDEEAKK